MKVNNKLIVIAFFFTLIFTLVLFLLKVFDHKILYYILPIIIFIFLVLYSSISTYLNKKEIYSELKKSANEMIKLKKANSDYRALNTIYKYMEEEIIELHNDNEKYVHIVNTISLGMLLVDSKDKVLITNRYVEEEFHVKNIKGLDIYSIDELKNISTVYKDFLASDETYEKKHIETDKNFLVKFRKINEVWIDDNIATLIIITDVTELMFANKIQQEFLSNASHELKTPITKIRAYSELLEESDKLDIDILKKIQKISFEMSGLINNILDISKLENDNYILKPTEVDVKQVIDEILEDYQQKIYLKRLNFMIDIDRNILFTDKAIFKLILSNLISNAIKYNKVNGKVYIVLVDDELVIEDTGIGISKESQSRVYERFYRVNTEIDGTGLGLAIVKQATNTLGFTLKMTSKVNKGTKFKIILRKGK